MPVSRTSQKNGTPQFPSNPGLTSPRKYNRAENATRRFPSSRRGSQPYIIGKGHFALPELPSKVRQQGHSSSVSFLQYGPNQRLLPDPPHTFNSQLAQLEVPLPDPDLATELEGFLQVTPSSNSSQSPRPPSTSDFTVARNEATSEESLSSRGPFADVAPPRRLYEDARDISLAHVRAVCTGSKLDSANAGSESASDELMKETAFACTRGIFCASTAEDRCN